MICASLRWADITRHLLIRAQLSRENTEKLTKCVIFSPLFINGQNLSGMKREKEVSVADSNSCRVASRKSVRRSVTISNNIFIFVAWELRPFFFIFWTGNWNEGWEYRMFCMKYFISLKLSHYCRGSQLSDAPALRALLHVEDVFICVI